MNCMCEKMKLPKVENASMIPTIKLKFSNEKEFVISVDGLVGIQFIKDDKTILVRRGRVKDIVLIKRRELAHCEDCESRIILDCSEQFSINIIEIKLKDIIDIDEIDYEFKDYSERITELKPNNIHGNTSIPVREHGMTVERKIPIMS